VRKEQSEDVEVSPNLLYVIYAVSPGSFSPGVHLELFPNGLAEVPEEAELNC
jgi:hypothetical protein